MKSAVTFFQRVALLMFAVIVAGCGSLPGSDDVLPDRKVEYKKSREVEKNLEIPPDLSKSSINDELVIPAGSTGRSSASMSSFESRAPRTSPGGGGGARVLPEVDNIQVKRDGNERWLVIQADPEQVWFKAVEFWQDNGILMEQQDPTVGIMVTDWVENRADISSDFVTDLFRGVFDGLYSASTRDQFRVRVEPGAEPGTTELFLTHRGMQETIVQDGDGDVERTVWNPRETDHGLEAAMLRRLMVYLGVEEQKASTQLAARPLEQIPRSQLNKTKEQVSLEVNEDFNRAWRLVGVALDRVGFAVEDRNRSQGVYFVRYNDPVAGVKDEGLLSKLAFWSDSDPNIDKENQYQVKLDGRADVTDVVVLNDKGERKNTETAERILSLLHEQIR